MPAVAICSFEGVVPIVCEQEKLMSQRNGTVSKRLYGLNFEKKVMRLFQILIWFTEISQSKRLNLGLLGTLVETIKYQK